MFENLKNKSAQPAEGCTPAEDGVTNILIAGLGGQGVITASQIVAMAAFLAGYDVKKSEIHGMSQRGGSVSSDVRYGSEVHSPIIPAGQVHFLVCLHPDENHRYKRLLHKDAVVLGAEQIPDNVVPEPRYRNTYLLGLLSRYLQLPRDAWRAAFEGVIKRQYLAENINVFEMAANRKDSPTQGP